MKFSDDAKHILETLDQNLDKLKEAQSEAPPNYRIVNFDLDIELLRNSAEYLKHNELYDHGSDYNKLISGELSAYLPHIVDLIKNPTGNNEQPYSNLHRISLAAHAITKIILVAKIPPAESIKKDFDVIQNSINDANSNLNKLNELIQKGEQSNANSARAVENANNAEERFVELETEIQAKMKDISAGLLAKNFNERKQELRESKSFWGKVVVALTIILLVIYYLFAGLPLPFEWINPFTNSGTANPSISTILLKLSMAAPLFFITFFAARNYRQAARAEEFYSFKSVSAALIDDFTAKFEDFDKKQGTNSNMAGEFLLSTIKSVTTPPPYYGDRPVKDEESSINSILQLLDKYKNVIN